MNFQHHLETFKFERLDFEDDFADFIQKTHPAFALAIVKRLSIALEARIMDSVPPELTRLYIKQSRWVGLEEMDFDNESVH